MNARHVREMLEHRFDTFVDGRCLDQMVAKGPHADFKHRFITCPLTRQRGAEPLKCAGLKGTAIEDELVVVGTEPTLRVAGHQIGGKPIYAGAAQNGLQVPRESRQLAQIFRMGQVLGRHQKGVSALLPCLLEIPQDKPFKFLLRAGQQNKQIMPRRQTGWRQGIAAMPERGDEQTLFQQLRALTV